MGKQIASDERFHEIRQKAIAVLLPDRAIIRPPDRREVTPSGTYHEVPSEPLIYNGLPFVPCRLDISKHYRAEEVFGQEAVVNDFELHVPFDAPLLADYKIEFKGESYEVRKLLDTNSFVVTKVALVNRVDIGKRRP